MRTSTRHAQLIGMAGLGILSIAIGACGGGDSHSSSGDGGGDSTGSSNSGGGAPSGKAELRVVHASPDAPKVDVYARGIDQPLLQGLSYGDASAYLVLDAGKYTIDLRAAPSKPSDPIAYSTGSIDVPAKAHVTAVAAGLFGSKGSADSFRVLPLVEAWDVAEAGQARVRIVHASADAPTVGIDVGNDDPAHPEVPSLKRFADTGSDGIALPSGQALQIGIDAAGQRVTAFTTPALPDQGDVLVIATGLLEELPRANDGFSLLAVGPDGSLGFLRQNPTVVALHASPDAPAVDIFSGDHKVADNAPFGALAPIQVPPGSYTLDLFAHSDDPSRPATPPVASAMVGPLAAGERYLAIATGFLSPATQKDQPLQIDAFHEEFAVEESTARVRAIHASPDAPAVDIGVSSGGPLNPVLVPDLIFPTATEEAGLVVMPGAVPIGIAPAGQDATIVGTFGLTATAGQRAFVIAAGALEPNMGQPFRLAVVDARSWPWTISHVLPN